MTKPRRERDARYNRSEKGRARNRRYNRSEKGLARGRRYENTLNGYLTRSRWYWNVRRPQALGAQRVEVLKQLEVVQRELATLLEDLGRS